MKVKFLSFYVLGCGALRLRSLLNWKERSVVMLFCAIWFGSLLARARLSRTGSEHYKVELCICAQVIFFLPEKKGKLKQREER